MKKKIVIKLSGRIFGIDNVKVLKEYASFLVKISKICQPIVIAGGWKYCKTLHFPCKILRS